MKPNVIAAVIAILLAGCARSPDVSDEPHDSRIDSLVKQLASAVPQERDAAAAEIEKLGSVALPAIRRAAADGSEEGKARAQRLVGAIERNEIFDKPSNAALRSLVAASADSSARRIAIHDWILTQGRSCELVETAIALAELDPAGIEGGIGLEALNQLLAPREVARLDKFPEMRSDGTLLANGKKTALEQIRVLLNGVAWEGSHEALARLEATPSTEIEMWPSQLVFRCVVDICDAGRVSLRLDEDRTAHIELPEESLAGWKAAWQMTRTDQWVLVELGLVPPPMVTDTSMADWERRLADHDARYKRAAFVTLREIPDALIPEFERLASTPASRDLLDRLRLRHRGRILFSTGGSMGEGLWLMNGDGSAPRRISGELHQVVPVLSPHIPQTDRELYAEEGQPKGPHNIYKLFADGKNAPLLARRDARLSISGKQQLPWLIIHEAGATIAWNVDTGGTEKPPGEWMTAFDWSCDGRLAWAAQDTDEYSLWTWEPGKEPTKFGPFPAQASKVRWRPDGRQLIYQTSFNTPDENQLILVDASTGKPRKVAGLPRDAGAAEWSPDGSELVFGAVGDSAVVLNPETGMQRGFEKSPPPSFSRSPWWSPDGKSLLLFGSPGRGPGIWVAEQDGSKIHHVKNGTYFAQWALGSEWLIEPFETELWLVSSDGSGRLVQLTDSTEPTSVFIQTVPASR